MSKKPLTLKSAIVILSGLVVIGLGILTFVGLILTSSQANAAPTGIVKKEVTDCISSTHLSMKRFHIGIVGGYNSILICSSGPINADDEMATMEVGSINLKFEFTKQDGKAVMDFIDIGLKGSTYNLTLVYENFARPVKNLVLYKVRTQIKGDRFIMMLLFVKSNNVGI